MTAPADNELRHSGGSGRAAKREKRVHWFEAFDRDPRTPTLCHTVRIGSQVRTTTIGHQVTCRACRYRLGLPEVAE